MRPKLAPLERNARRIFVPWAGACGAGRGPAASGADADLGKEVMTAMTTLASARSGLSAIAAIILIVGAGRPADAQAQDSSSAAQSTDTSYFNKYHPAPRDTLAPAAYAGWERFQVNCSRCHGQDAEGTSFAPSLVQALGPGGEVRTESAFLEIACDGRPSKGMPPWCALGLGKDKLEAIYLYVKGRAGGTIHPGRPMAREDSTAVTGSQ
jgi:mono/diheme cytochrome c family protein